MSTSFLSRVNRRISVARCFDLLRSIYGGSQGWQHHLILRPMTMADGSVHEFMVMRQKIAGKWYYRAPTDDEKSEFDAQRHW